MNQWPLTLEGSNTPGDQPSPGVTTIGVALVSMPFASHRRPSLQLGLLKAIAEKHGFEATTHHFALDFAVLIGQRLYHQLAQMFRHDLLGDWLFSVEAFREEAPDPGHELSEAPTTRIADLGVTPEKLRRLREVTVPAYIGWLATHVDWSRYSVVGFTTTFQQTVASLALARQLKERHPSLTIIFGGANCEDVMGAELLAKAPWIDYVVLGEGDETFPQLLAALSEGRDTTQVRGLAIRRGNSVVLSPPADPFAKLDDLPTPDYSEYFDSAEALGVWSPADRHHAVLPFESARGCWWGAKAHCTFCGLNGRTMAFRAKSARRVAAELAELVSRYSSFRLYAVDNIVSAEYLAGLFQHMQDGQTDYEIFYEVKSHLGKHELRTLCRAGVLAVQPGIESLSTPVLKLMKKGVSALQNVNFLRWATCYGMDVTWLLIWGFPGERADWYSEQAALMPSLVHLVPPKGGGRIRMERFSPIFNDPASFPRRMMKPMPSYSHVYPARFDLNRLAYFFDYEFVDGLPDDAYATTELAMNRWIAAWAGSHRPSMTFWASPDRVLVEDLRVSSNPSKYELSGLEAAVFKACSDTPLGLSRIVELARSDDAAEVEGVIRDLVAEGLIAAESDRYLTLPLPASGGR